MLYVIIGFFIIGIGLYIFSFFLATIVNFLIERKNKG